MNRYTYYIEYTYGNGHNINIDANTESEAEDYILEENQNVKKLLLRETKKIK